MAYSCDTSKFYTINNYADAVRRVESTKPIRGTDIRPLRRDRSQPHNYNIRFVRSPNKDTLPDVAVRHHNTDVIIYHADETVSIHNYNSQSTTALQDAIVPYGLAVYRRNGYKLVNGWAFSPDRSYMTLTKTGIQQWRPIDNEQIGYPVAPGRKFPDKEIGRTMRQLSRYVRALKALNNGDSTKIASDDVVPLVLTPWRCDSVANDVRQFKADLPALLGIYGSRWDSDQERAAALSQFLRLAPVPNAEVKKGTHTTLSFGMLKELYPDFAANFSFVS